MANTNNNKTLNVPNLRFPEFKGEWKKEWLKDIAQFIKGTGISKDQLSKDGVSCILYGELYTKYKYEIIDRIVSKTNITSKNLTRSCKNDVIIPCSGETAVDIATARCVPFDGILLGGDLSVIRLNHHDGGFMSYQLNGKRRLDIAKAAQGVSVVHLYEEHIKNIKTFNPSLAEQIKIAKLLRLLDQRIETQNKIIEKLQSLIKGIGDKLLFNDEWPAVRLCDILTERLEKSKKNNQHEVLSSTIKGIYAQRKYFSKDIASENNVGYKIICLHDIVLSPQNLWMGNINYNNKFDIGIVSPSYKIYKVSPKFDRNFVASMLKTHRALYDYLLVSEQGASVVRRNLNMEAFEQLTFKIPPYELQIKIGCTLSSMQKLLENAIAMKQAYDNQKKYLLQQMFI
jgi:type I restriction enzyme S subunit